MPPLLMGFRIRAVSDLLEPCEVKVSSTVLRGAAGGDTRGLPGGGSNVLPATRPHQPLDLCARRFPALFGRTFAVHVRLPRFPRTDASRNDRSPGLCCAALLG